MHYREWPGRSQEERRKAYESFQSATGFAAAGDRRYRAHPLGHAWSSVGDKRSSSQDRADRRSPQRDHRELQFSQRVAPKDGAHVQKRDRYGGHSSLDRAEDK